MAAVRKACIYCNVKNGECKALKELFCKKEDKECRFYKSELLYDSADGCSGCAFEDVEEWEMPCTKCSRNCKDYYRTKEGSDKLPTAKTYLDALTGFRESLRKAGGIMEGTEIQNNAFSECREKLKSIYTGGYSKALFNFYKRLSECSEYARPVGWSTSQEIVQFQNVKQIYEQLKAGDSYGADIK